MTLPPEMLLLDWDTLMERLATPPQRTEIPPPLRKRLLGITEESDAPRHRLAWQMRQNGHTYIEIGAALNITPQRARQIVVLADKRIARACSIYSAPVLDPVATGVWHTFTHSGRLTKV